VAKSSKIVLALVLFGLVLPFVSAFIFSSGPRFYPTPIPRDLNLNALDLNSLFVVNLFAGREFVSEDVNILRDANIFGDLRVFGDSNFVTIGFSTAFGGTIYGDMNGYVPYAGAVQDVDLGIYDLRATEITTGQIKSINNAANIFDISGDPFSISNVDLRVTAVRTSTIEDETGASKFDVSGTPINVSVNMELADNIKAFFGTASDSSIYYSGTNMLIDPKEVGSGEVIIDGVARILEDLGITGDLNVEGHARIESDLNVAGDLNISSNIRREDPSDSDWYIDNLDSDVNTTFRIENSSALPDNNTIEVMRIDSSSSAVDIGELRVGDTFVMSADNLDGKGDFGNAGDWALGADWAIVGGQLVFTEAGSGGSISSMVSPPTFQANTTYRVIYTIVANTLTDGVFWEFPGGTRTTKRTTTGTFTEAIRIGTTGASLTVEARIGAGGEAVTIDDVNIVKVGDSAYIGYLYLDHEITPTTTGVTNIGSSSLKFKDIYLSGAMSIAGAISTPTYITAATSIRTPDLMITGDNEISWRPFFFLAADALAKFDGDSLNIIANNATATDDLEITADDMIVDADLNVLGEASIPATYMQASDVSDQSFAATGTPYSIELDTVDKNFGISRIEDGNILIRSIGVYSIIAQPQVTAAAGQSGNFHMWLQRDTGAGFADISNTNVELTLGSQDEDVIPLIAILSLNEGDEIRLRASVSNTGITLDTQSPAGEPVIPSIIFSMYKIGT